MEKPSRFLANSSTALEQLRGLINQHESTPGTPLPTERELSETLGVGRREVRRALDVLEEEGRIWRDDRDLKELWDSAFHRAIAEAAGNRLMLGLFDAIDAVRREPGWQHLRELARTPERVDSYNDHHHKIMSAIIHRQPNEAAAAMREHLLSLQSALIQAIHLEDDFTL